LGPNFYHLINQFNFQNETPLFLAVSSGHAPIVDLLLRHGAVPDLVFNNRHDFTELVDDDGDHHSAVATEHNNANDYYDTPLVSACLHGRADIVALLLEAGADPHIVGTALSPLTAACQSGHIAIVELLLSHKVDIESKDRFGSTGLIRAVRQGHLDCVVCLLRHKADVNAVGENGTTALITCALEHHINSIYIGRALLLAGADVNYRGEGGSTALLHAADKGFADLVKLLLQHSADPQITNTHGHTPLIRTIYWNRAAWANHDSMLMLLKAGSDVNHRAEHGNTALHVATHRAFIDAIIILINHGANVNATNNEGVTPLMRAASWGFIGPIQALLYAGAEVHWVDKLGRSALFHAAALDHLDAVRTLLEWHAPPGTKAFNGKTPLDIAREKEFTQIVGLLETAIQGNAFDAAYFNSQTHNNPFSSPFMGMNRTAPFEQRSRASQLRNATYQLMNPLQQQFFAERSKSSGTQFASTMLDTSTPNASQDLTSPTSTTITTDAVITSGDQVDSADIYVENTEEQDSPSYKPVFRLCNRAALPTNPFRLPPLPQSGLVAPVLDAAEPRSKFLQGSDIYSTIIGRSSQREGQTPNPKLLSIFEQASNPNVSSQAHNEALIKKAQYEQQYTQTLNTIDPLRDKKSKQPKEKKSKKDRKEEQQLQPQVEQQQQQPSQHQNDVVNNDGLVTANLAMVNDSTLPHHTSLIVIHLEQQQLSFPNRFTTPTTTPRI
jgi:ankyrin repeat protein